jgi:hypothetical protein
MEARKHRPLGYYSMLAQRKGEVSVLYCFAATPQNNTKQKHFSGICNPQSPIPFK